MNQEYSLFSDDGYRKYLDKEERTRFLDAIPKLKDSKQRTFALVLFYTGCRLMEAAAIRYQDVLLEDKVLVIRTLKQRNKNRVRRIPIPDFLVEKLDDVHNISKSLRDKRFKSDTLLWDATSATTYWTWIKRVMETANIKGLQATAKGLRHSFVIAHLMAGTPENVIMELTGHRNPQMMAIYGNVLGAEQRTLAAKIWRND